MAERVPVTIVTGFLGAGKTTLLNRLIGWAGGPVAVIENELGEVGVDAELVVGAGAPVVAIDGGCVCCSTQAELVAALVRLAERPLGRVLIETTGVADPAPVVQTLRVTPQVRERFRLDGVITVVDGRHAGAAPSDLWARQVGFADAVLISKADRCDPAEVAALRDRLQALNPSARIEAASPAWLDLGAYDADRPLRLLPAPGAHDGLAAVSITEPGRVDAARFDLWMRVLWMDLGGAWMRAKGVLHVVGAPVPLRVHVVFGDVDADEAPADDTAAPLNRLVFIGRGLDAEALRAGFRACVA